MGDLIAGWYDLLSTFTRALTDPVVRLSDLVGLPPLTAVLLGLLGSVSPCQITTGLGAAALVGRRPGARTLVAGLFYALGKATTYALLGLLFVLLGQAIAQSTIPVIQVVRRALGPLMLIAGLVLLDIVRPRLAFGPGQRIADAAALRFDAGRPAGAFVLGATFALAFCPTLFFLFFGLLIPLALATPGGVVYPALFAFGTTIPMLVLLAALTFGLRGASEAGGLATRVQPALTRAAGLVLLLAGLNDTIVYWFV